MILDTAQLRTILHNALNYSFDDKGHLHVCRFSKQQMDIYAQDTRDWTLKTRSSASVTFDFITNSDYISLQFDLFPGSSQGYASIDLYVDGVFYNSRVMEDLSFKLAGFSLPEGEHRVTVYFPWSTETVFTQVHLSDGATVIPVKKRCRILSFGDSITQGHVAKFTSLSYINQMARELDAEVFNQGIGGYYFNEAVIDESIVDVKPDLITVAYGTNDYSRRATLEEYKEHAERYIKKLRSLFPNVPIVGILPIFRDDLNYHARALYRTYSLDEARQVLRECYQSLPDGYVVEETGIPHLPQFFVADLLHPNDFGFTLMAQGIVSKLKAILDARQ